MDLNVNTRSDAGSGKKRNNQLQEEKEKENYRHWESEEGKQKKEEKKKIQPQKRKRRYENFMKEDSEEEDVGDANPITDDDDDEATSKLGKHPKSKPINLVTVGRCLTQQIDSSKIEVWQHPQPPKTIHLKLKDCSKNDNISVEIDNCKP